ncbi:MAG: hypothetical protein E7501_03205 [Ruminococcus sp.]|nr:hypothetical protein [Ruminococcus sp.]
MTATQLNGSTKRNPFLNNLWFKISDNRLLFLVSSVLQVCGMLITVISTLLVLHADKEDEVYGTMSEFWWFWEDNGEGFMLLGMAVFAIGLLLMLPIAFGCFDYLYKKARVDMILSLPMTSTQRFWSDYVSGLAMSLVPTLVSVILGVSIGGVGLWAILEGYSEWRHGFTMLLMEIIPLLLGCLSLYSATVFILCCCGSRAETTLALLAFFSVPPMLVGLFWLALESASVYMYEATELMYVVKFMGPVGSAVMAVEWIDLAGSAANVSEFPYFSMLIWAVQYLLGTALLVLISWRLYLHRKAEDTAKPFVYRFLYHGLMIAGVFTFFLFFIAMDFSMEVLVPAAVFGLIAYLLIEVGVHRTLKRLYLAVARYAVTAVLSVALIVTAADTECFGMQHYIPNASSVYTVSGYMPRFDTLSGYSYEYYYELDDSESIRLLTELQKQCGWKINEAGSYPVMARYTLDIGMVMTRFTTVKSDAELEKLAEFQLRPEIFADIARQYQRRKGVVISCYGSRYDISLTEQQTTELWDLYLSASRELTVEKLYESPVAYMSDMPLYAGVHDAVQAYILECGGMPAGSEFALTPGSVTAVPVLISTDSAWYNKIQQAGFEWLIFAEETENLDQTVLDGMTVGYTPEQISALTFGVTLFADKPEWVVWIDGTFYAVRDVSSDEAAALAAQGTPLTGNDLRIASEYDMLYNASPRILFGWMDAGELEWAEQRGAMEIYRRLYPYREKELQAEIEKIRGSVPLDPVV